MTEQLQVLALPFLACLILTGIHAYLGIHVLSRKVIFVDIALAQIAALGATLAYVLGHDPRSEGAYWFSLCFAVLAAAIFALTRTRVERVPQEAIIGLTYAVASAAAILLADLSPHGAEHLKDLLAGSIVWVTPHQIIKTGILYSIIGAFHFVFRKTFLLISLNPEAAYARGIRVRLWDFFFYLSFGVVITSSVQIAGVLLVFCYLVAPAVFAVMFSDRLRTRLALGWGIGTVVSAFGLLFSYDRPSGPTIMVCFALVLILGGIIRAIFTAPNRMRAAVWATVCTLLIGALGYTVVTLGTVSAVGEEGHEHATPGSHADDAHPAPSDPDPSAAADVEELMNRLRDPQPGVRARAAADLEALDDRTAAPALAKALGDPSTAVRENAARALGKLGDPSATDPLRAVMNGPDEDEWVVLRAAASLASLGDPSGIPVLLRIARSGDARLARVEALSTAGRLAGVDTTQAGDDAGTQALLSELDRWWAAAGSRVTYDPARGGYVPSATVSDRAR